MLNDTGSILFIVNAISFGIFYVIPAYFGSKIARSIFVSKKWNPTVGLIVGGITGLIFSIVGLILLWLIYNRTIEKIKKYPLYRGGSERLEVRWTYGIKNIKVLFDNVELGQITGVKEAKKGKAFKLPDGSDLFVKIVLGDDLLVNPNPLPALELNGKPIPNSTNDPAVEISRTSKLFIIGGISTILSAVIGFSTDPYNQDFNSLTLFIGVVALICGIFIQRRSRIAFSIGIIIAFVSITNFCQAIGANSEFFKTIFDFYGAINFALGLRKANSALYALEKEKPVSTK